LPAENAAIKAKSHPKKFTEKAIKNFTKQMKALGFSYDWSRKVECHKPEYYRWDQWIFLKMFERGLAYRKKAPVNYCKKCKTVLANEQVVQGKCWRHEDTEVEIKELEQWFLKTTEYADELNSELDKLDEWPELIKKLQRNWIGKSHGTEVDFLIGNIIGKEFVFFHAYQDNSKSVFWPWLRKEIESRGGKVVFAPDLPNTNNPDINEQVDYVLKNHEFNENTIIVAHSLGNLLLMKLLPKLKKKIHKIIMVSAPLRPEFADGKKRPILENCCDFKFDFKEIKNKVREVVVLADKNDHFLPISHTREVAEKLSGKFISTIGKKTHFNNDVEPEILDAIVKRWKVFTTRPDTLFGVTSLVVSAQHTDLSDLVTSEQEKKVHEFTKKLFHAEKKDLDKEGVFTGSYAEHPLTKEKIPIWAGNFVIADYGSGMVMTVPAHDHRDFEFAKKYGLQIKEVVRGDKKVGGAYTGHGVLVNSEGFDGLKSREAIEHITNALEMKKLGRKKVAYRLKDWLISRQRFWGTPIPIVYCDSCGIVPVPEKDLPVKLPDNIKFKGVGNPLEKYAGFVKVKCPTCGKQAKRETDTMDTFANSSWYFLRYTDTKNSKKIFDPKKAEYWMPIDQYIGGKEHAYLHLIYFRFYTKFLRDLGLLKFGEPAKRLFNQGFLHGSDGRKMSKSYGNVVSPEKVSKKFGLDAARMFLVSVASPDKDVNWSDKGAEGSLRFILRVMNFVKNFKSTGMTRLQESKLNRGIRDYTSDLESFRYNLAVIKLRGLFSVLEGGCDKKALGDFLRLLAPICPHIAEELWSKLGNKKLISLSSWPEYDKRKINDKLEEEVSKVGKTVEDIKNILKILSEKGKKVNKVHLYVLPQEKKNYDSKILSEKIGKEVSVYSVADKDKYDPENKSKKVKPGRPGIYVE